MNFFARLLSLNKEKLSEKEFRRFLGIERHLWRYWEVHAEAGRPVQPKVDTVKQIAQKAGVSFLWLWDGIGPQDLEEARKLFNQTP